MWLPTLQQMNTQRFMRMTHAEKATQELHAGEGAPQGQEQGAAAEREPESNKGRRTGEWSGCQ
jgi:hypothetical protein